MYDVCVVLEEEEGEGGEVGIVSVETYLVLRRTHTSAVQPWTGFCLSSPDGVV